jgi:hypothetical protein
LPDSPGSLTGPVRVWVVEIGGIFIIGVFIVVVFIAARGMDPRVSAGDVKGSTARQKVFHYQAESFHYQTELSTIKLNVSRSSRVSKSFPLSN